MLEHSLVTTIFQLTVKIHCVFTTFAPSKRNCTKKYKRIPITKAEVLKPTQKNGKYAHTCVYTIP